MNDWKAYCDHKNFIRSNYHLRDKFVISLNRSDLIKIIKARDNIQAEYELDELLWVEE